MDERQSGGAAGDPGPEPGRRYAVPFREVWAAVLAVVAERRGWEVSEADPRAGALQAQVRGPLRRSPRPVEIRVRLDEMGRTCVDVRFRARSGELDPRAGRRGGARFLRHLDRALRRRGAG